MRGAAPSDAALCSLFAWGEWPWWGRGHSWPRLPQRGQSVAGCPTNGTTPLSPEQKVLHQQPARSPPRFTPLPGKKGEARAEVGFVMGRSEVVAAGLALGVEETVVFHWLITSGATCCTECGSGASGGQACLLAPQLASEPGHLSLATLVDLSLTCSQVPLL